MTHSIRTRPTVMSGTVTRMCLPALAALMTLHLGSASVQAGQLYVAQYGNNTIVSFDTNASPPTPTSFASTGLDRPYFLAFDAGGNLYAANSLSNTIERFTPSGVGSVFASTGVYPIGLAFDASGNLYVANEVSNTIEKFTPGGVGSVFSTGEGPAGLAFDKAGNLYVANHASGTIERFTPNGVGSIFASTGLNHPVGLAFDAAGNLYSTLDNNTIERFTPGGVGSVFASTGLNSEPSALAFDAAGNLYVSNLNNGTIERFTPGGVGSLFTNLASPFGLAFRPSSVPEPSSLVLAIVGATVVLGYGCYRGRRPRLMAESG